MSRKRAKSAAFFETGQSYAIFHRFFKLQTSPATKKRAHHHKPLEDHLVELGSRTPRQELVEFDEQRDIPRPFTSCDKIADEDKKVVKLYRSLRRGNERQ